jgi:hypothetical protein
LTGEGWGEGEKEVFSIDYIPLPSIPSPPRRRLYEPEAFTKGGRVFSDFNKFPPLLKGGWGGFERPQCPPSLS